VPVTGVVSGQVTIKNTPYSFYSFCQSTNSNGCIIETPAVPAGKRLVLQQVSGSIQIGTEPVQNYIVFLGSGPAHLNLLPRLVSSFSGTTNYSINETVLVYVEAGQTITVSPSGFGLGIIATTVLSGHLVDAN
jgi:hypothetical protein